MSRGTWATLSMFLSLTRVKTFRDWYTYQHEYHIHISETSACKAAVKRRDCLSEPTLSVTPILGDAVAILHSSSAYKGSRYDATHCGANSVRVTP